MENKILSKEEIKTEYGLDFDENQKVHFEVKDVPEKLHVLVPYAEYWGVIDDWAREELIQQTPDKLKDNLKWVITQFDDELDDWLAGEEASEPEPSDAYLAFSSMRMGVDFI